MYVCMYRVQYSMRTGDTGSMAVHPIHRALFFPSPVQPDSLAPLRLHLVCFSPSSTLSGALFIRFAFFSLSSFFSSSLYRRLLLLFHCCLPFFCFVLFERLNLARLEPHSN